MEPTICLEFCGNGKQKCIVVSIAIDHILFKLQLNINHLLLIESTSVLKSQSGDGVRRSLFSACASLMDGEQLGSSGITANLPRCKQGDVGPYVPKINKR